MKNVQLPSPKEFYGQLLYTFHTIPEVWPFIRKHRIWEGFWRYGWVARLLVVVALIAGLKFISLMYSFFSQVQADSPEAIMNTLNGFYENVLLEEYQFFYLGGVKYLILILLEIVIFHVTRTTVAVLTGSDSDATLNAFTVAQIRMIKVAIYAYVMGLLLSVAFDVVLSIANLPDFFKNPLNFFVQCYFMGFTVMDNYYEQFGMDIRTSAGYNTRFAGVSLAVGFIMQLLFLIPVIGTVAGPFFAAVLATIILFELTDIHRRPATASSNSV